MSSARVEELSDSDPDEMDITDIDAPYLPTTAPIHNAAPTPNTTLMSPTSIPASATQPAPRGYDKERVRSWQCLYPLYFDAGRTRSQGRRVGKELAVHNPLAKDVVQAAGEMGLQVAFEPGKCHPKDWANPGRVKVLVKEGGEVVSGKGVDSKHHLYLKVAEYLRAHPTTEASPLSLRIPGMPPRTEPLPPPAVPRGWKMSTILPLHSPAVTGGGVSENLFKDMMAEMGGQGGDGSQGGGSAGKKKDKKKIKG